MSFRPPTVSASLSSVESVESVERVESVESFRLHTPPPFRSRERDDLVHTSRSAGRLQQNDGLVSLQVKLDTMSRPSKASAREARRDHVDGSLNRFVNNPKFSDVTFLVGKRPEVDDGDMGRTADSVLAARTPGGALEERKESQHAAKASVSEGPTLIFGVRESLVEASPVFREMFDDHMVDECDEADVVHVPDCTPRGFLTMVRYLITGQRAVVDSTNVHETVHCARRFEVQSLVDLCAECIGNEYRKSVRTVLSRRPPALGNSTASSPSISASASSTARDSSSSSPSILPPQSHYTSVGEYHAQVTGASARRRKKCCESHAWGFIDANLTLKQRTTAKERETNAIMLRNLRKRGRYLGADERICPDYDPQTRSCSRSRVGACPDVHNDNVHATDIRHCGNHLQAKNGSKCSTNNMNCRRIHNVNSRVPSGIYNPDPKFHNLRYSRVDVVNARLVTCFRSKQSRYFLREFSRL